MIGAVVISKTTRAWLSLKTYSSSSFGEPWQSTRPVFDSTGPSARRWRKWRLGAERGARVPRAADFGGWVEASPLFMPAGPGAGVAGGWRLVPRQAGMASWV